MTNSRSPWSRMPGVVLLLVLTGVTALYWDAIRAPFLNDDFLFLEQARQRRLIDSLVDLGPLGNYYRPLARQIYFELLTPIAHGHPLVFHLVNYALFLTALALLADLLSAVLPRQGVLAGTLYFAMLPFQRVNLMWVSCSQDLLALAGTLAALALYRRGRTLGAALCFVVAFTSKETALALPLGLVAWDRSIERRAWPEVARRGAPFVALAAAWTAVALWMRARQPHGAPLDLTPAAFAFGLLHGLQSILGLDHPSGFGAALATNGPALVPLLLLVIAAFWLVPASAPPDRDEARSVSRNALITFAAAWFVAFALPAGPVSYSWSSYYYTLACVGAAVIVGWLFVRADRWGWLALVAGLSWWHAAGSHVPAFAIAERRGVWTSHLTPFYFQRAAVLTDSLSRELRRVEPHPERHTHFFFATLPSYAGFQMGNGALIRSLYRDSTLASFFYSQFSETTANGWPSRFLFWDGRQLIPLYASARDPWFQIGSDLLLLDKPAGARFAFLRALQMGGDRMDNLYWLGWAELMAGHRDRAEDAWTAFGAKDDSLKWSAHIRAAHNAVTDGDTVSARRHLVVAIQYGIGRPEAHAVLGEFVLEDREPYVHKYGLMELKVATWLNPRDWEARKRLVRGLAMVRLEEQTRHELTTLIRDFPATARDTAIARIAERYGEPDREDQVVDMGAR